MKVGDLVRPKSPSPWFLPPKDYQGSTCIVIATYERMDGLIIEIMNSEAGVTRRHEEDLVVINEAEVI